MGFHATINAGTDQFGNAKHKSAPRVRVTERVTGSMQVRKFHALAGPVVLIDDPLVAMLAGNTKVFRPKFADIFTDDLLPQIKERGATFRPVLNEKGKPTGAEMLRIANGILHMYKYDRTVDGKKYSAWVGEFLEFGQEPRTGRTVIAKMITKGEPVKGDVRAALLNRALLGK